MLEKEIEIVSSYIAHGEYCPPVQEAWQTLKTAVLAQQANNTAMREIVLVLKEIISDIETDGTLQVKFYNERLNAVLALLQQ
jgi:hypothetical protein